MESYFLLLSVRMKGLIEKLIRKTYQLERLVAGGKISPIDGMMVMRKILKKEFEKNAK